MSYGLHLVVLEVTGRCNLSCNYCYRREGASVDLHDSSLILSQFAELMPSFLIVSGGEPLLAENIFTLAKEFKKVCKRLILTTNGSLVKEFPKSYFHIFDGVQISLDGDKQVHDSLRGKGNFESAVNAAIYLQGTTPVSFLCTMNSANYPHLDTIAQIAQEVGAVPKIGRMCGFDHGDPFPLSNPCTWKSTLEEAAHHGILNDDPLNFWFDEKKKKSIHKEKIVGGCTAGIAGVAISPELDVYPCVKLRIPAGNLKEQSLKDIWLHSPLFASLRDWHNLKGHCPSCEYVSICRGCRADAWARTGDYLAPDPLCWLNGRGEE
ncbi:MAG: radical SAM protein [Methanothrix sp.]|nr:radical SAM protein [Methanothrix sp.]